MACSKGVKNLKVKSLSDAKVETVPLNKKLPKKVESVIFDIDAIVRERREWRYENIKRIYGGKRSKFEEKRLAEERLTRKLEKIMEDKHPSLTRCDSGYIAQLATYKIFYNNIKYVLHNEEVITRIIFLFEQSIKGKMFPELLIPNIEKFLRKNKNCLVEKVHKYVEFNQNIFGLKGKITSPKKQKPRNEKKNNSDYTSLLPVALGNLKEFLDYTFKQWTLLSLDNLFLNRLYNAERTKKFIEVLRRFSEPSVNRSQNNKSTPPKRNKILNDFIKIFLKKKAAANKTPSKEKKPQLKNKKEINK